ncbi:MAG: chemotaxis protein CheA [Magnetococcales bacterium]|nr:chemotaxis protein CheA [Magnetococcales bacterium]
MFDEASQQAFLQEFFSENREALDRIERGLLQLEGAPTNRDLLNSVFRDMHTVKGNCRMLGFERLEELTHSAESLLDLLRDGKLLIDTMISNSLLEVMDGVRRTLQIIEKTGKEGEVDFASLIFQLAQFQGEGLQDQKENPTEMAESSLHVLPSDTGGSSRTDAESSPARMDSIRLPIERLDGLMNQVGELSAMFNQLKYAITRNPAQVEHALEGLEQQIHGLQGEVLQYRLQPIGRILETYHRLVRDLAVETKKKVVLELHGEETEVDRNVLIAIKEVLGHLIRNAVDHGIEPPADRVEVGKSPVGRVRLSAEQKQGQIYLEIVDDGRGIDVARVRAKAIDKGLVTPVQAMELQESEIMKFIMAPGFSTVEQVSKISGRGTGMDVVQAAIDKLGGSIAISSQYGVGSRFRLRIPQTMAIVPVLSVVALGETYAVPQMNIIELISYYGHEVARHVEGKMQAPMVRVRDRLLPLISLRQTLTLADGEHGETCLVKQLQVRPELHIVVLQADDKMFGLEVDGIKEPSNLVVKPLNKIFNNISILAGTTVMPDGSIAFLLNVPALLYME